MVSTLLNRRPPNKLPARYLFINAYGYLDEILRDLFKPVSIRVQENLRCLAGDRWFWNYQHDVSLQEGFHNLQEIILVVTDERVSIVHRRPERLFEYGKDVIHDEADQRLLDRCRELAETTETFPKVVRICWPLRRIV
jgi:hypothetical protein